MTGHSEWAGTDNGLRVTPDHNPDYGRLNWAQASWFAGWRLGESRQSHLTHPYVNNHVLQLDLSEVRVDEARSAVRQLLARHDALRTTLTHDGRGSGQQQVSSREAVADEFAEVLDVIGSDSVEEYLGGLATTSFDLSAGWPTRVGVVDVGGLATSLLIGVDHSAADGWGVTVLLRELAAMLNAGSRKAVEPACHQICQPLDLVRWENSADGAAHADAALRFWQHQLADFSTDYGVSPTSGYAPGDEPKTRLNPAPHFVSNRLSSASLFDVLRTLSSRLRVPVSTVLLTAFGTALCQLGGVPAVLVAYTVFNRWGSAQLNSVSNMFMRVPVVVRPAGSSLTVLARSVLAQQVTGHSHAHVDRLRTTKLADTLLPRGLSPAVTDSSFNYLTATPALVGRHVKLPAQPRQSPRDEEITTVRHELGGRPVKFEVLQTGSSVELTLTARVDVLDPALAGELLRRVRALLNAEIC